MASKKELQALILIAGKIDPSLQQAFNKASSSSSKLGDSVKKASSNFSSLGDIIKGTFVGGMLANATQNIISKVKEIASNGLQLASDLTEVQNVVDTTFGKNSGQINSWSQKALNAFGLTELQAKQFSGTMGAMLESSGIAGQSVVKMSENLTSLSGDLASFYNLSQDDAFEKIRSGISGETEPLKSLGINMSVANLQAYALSKGIKTSYQDMDQASQTALRYSYLMNVTKNVQGDFNKTTGSFANQSRLLQANLNQIAAKVMSAVLPALTSLQQRANKVIGSLTSNPEKMQNLQNAVKKIGDYIGIVFTDAQKLYDFISSHWNTIEPLIFGIVGAMAAWKAITLGIAIYSTIMEAISLATDKATAAQATHAAVMLADPTTWIVLAIVAAVGLLIAAGVALYKNWDTVSAALNTAWVAIKYAFATGVNWCVDKINWLIEKLNKLPGVSIPLIGKVTAISPTLQKKLDNGALTSGATSVNYAAMAKHANGGLATQPSIFGEAGPEMAIPIRYKDPRSLSLLSQTAKAIGADSQGSGMSLNFTYAPVINGGNKVEIQTVLDADKEKFKAMIEEFFEDKVRVAYGS